MNRDFEALFKTCFARLARVLYRVTCDTARAEEAASEAFWRLYRKPPRDRTNLEGWLYRTALRAALDQLKMERRRSHYEALVPMPAGDSGPSATFECGEAQDRVRTTLAMLDPDEAALIPLRADGFSYAELAQSLNLNPQSIGTLLSRAQRSFREEYLKRYGRP